MDSFFQFSTLIDVATWILVASIKTTPLILILVLFRGWIRRHFSASARHSLWYIILFSLLVPFGWSANINQQLPFDRAAVSSSEAHLSLPATRQTANDEVSNLDENENARAPETSLFYATPLAWFALTWILGAFVMLGITIFQTWQCYRIKRFAVPPEKRLGRLFETCRHQLGARQTVRLLQTDTIESPTLIGYFSPAIVIPANLENSTSDEELNHIFLHELAHVKRHDLLFNWLVCISQILHWFNPLTWQSGKLMRADMEAACDALVLSQLPSSGRKSYGNTLIKLSESFESYTPSGPALGILENHTELMERIKMITQFKRMNTLMLLAFCLTFTALSLIACTQPEVAASKDDKLPEVSHARNMSLEKFTAISQMRFNQDIYVGRDYLNEVVHTKTDLDTISYPDFLAILKVNGFAAVKSENHIEIIPVEFARSASLPVVEEGVDYYDDEWVTDFIPLEKSCAMAILPMIRPLIPKHGHLSVQADTNSLLISDTYANVQRMKKVVSKISGASEGVGECKPLSAS